MVLDNDWKSSQLVQEISLAQKFGQSAPITVTIPPSGSHSFTITLAVAQSGDPVATTSSGSLGADVGVYSRSVAGGVEIVLRNFSTTLPASLAAITFNAVIFQEVI